ncbi:MAG: HAMP domain-containing histidine kinase [Oscillospiraceae bacterium]|jgi:signal transduction histidine kinase|nr:HAMP domain-containing histidine kinase [Oscillospiraceae bacterium]
MSRRKSIATRWFINSFSVVAVFLLVVNVSVYFALRYYYYGAVRQHLGTQANIVYGVLSYMEDYVPEIRRTIEEFDKKNHMELMAITADGRVDLTSGGFSPEEGYEMPDYERAKASDSRIADYVGFLPNSERYMAVTVMLSGEVYDAIRVVSSLDRVDMQIYTTTLIIAVLSAAIMLFVLFLGMYFIKSIVSPLRQIGNAAKRLAAGDFSDRVLLKKSDDEIGELCLIFNSMADDLENSEKIKNDFISSVSHELRTPLTAIRGWSETVLEVGSDEESRKTFEKGMNIIASETSRLSEMVEDLLDFSKMQSGRLKLQKSNMDVLAELADAVSIYAEKAKKEKINLTYSEPDFIAMIYGDKNRIRQVFINIIDNAVKYSAFPNGGGAVTVEAGIVEAIEMKLVITVSDNGRGISERDLPKVKARFFKANNSVRGSGIGLAVADEIIIMHEGTLLIDSVQGKGTTVKITLPAKVMKT